MEDIKPLLIKQDPEFNAKSELLNPLTHENCKQEPEWAGVTEKQENTIIATEEHDFDLEDEGEVRKEFPDSFVKLWFNNPSSAAKNQQSASSRDISRPFPRLGGGSMVMK